MKAFKQLEEQLEERCSKSTDMIGQNKASINLQGSSTPPGIGITQIININNSRKK